MKNIYILAFIVFVAFQSQAQTWTTFQYENTRENWVHKVQNIKGINEDEMFLMTSSSLLFRKYMGNTDSLTQFNYIRDFDVAPDSSLYCLSTNHILRFKDNFVDTFQISLGNYPTSLTINGNKLWAGSFTNGIVGLDLTTFTYTSLDSINSRPLSHVSLVFTDNIGNLYGVCQSGLFKFDGNNGFWLDTSNVLYANDALVRNDTIWMATNTGLKVFSQDSLIEDFTRFNSGLAMNYCSDLAWHNDRLFVSHYSDGLTFVELESGYSVFDGTSFTHHSTILGKEDYSLCFEEIGGTLFMGTLYGPMLEYSDLEDDWIKEHGFNLNSEETRIQILQNNIIAACDNNSVCLFNEDSHIWQENDYSDDFGFSIFRPTKFGKNNMFGTKSQYGPAAIVELNDEQLTYQLTDFGMHYYHETLKRAWGFQYGNFGYFSFINNVFVPIQNLGDVKHMYFDEHTQQIWVVHFLNNKGFLVKLNVNGILLDSWQLSLENDFYTEYSIYDLVVVNSQKVWIAVNELYSYESKLIIFDVNAESEFEMKNDFGGLVLPDFHVEKMEVDCDNRVWIIFNQISSNKGIVIADSEDFFFNITEDNSDLYDDKVYDLNFYNQTMWLGVKSAMQSVRFSSGCSAISMGVEGDVDLIVELFPNPSKGEFFINVFEHSIFKIHDVNGRLMYSREVDQGLNNIRLDIIGGMYIASITTIDGKVTTQKLVIE